MSIPSIIVGEGNWAGKSGNLLGYAVSDVKIVPREFTVSRALNTATRVNASGNIEGVLANVPRIDYFGGQASLFVEPSAANYLVRSQEFDNVSWGKSVLGINTSIGTNGIEANVAISPDGTQNADRVNFLLQTDTDLGLSQTYGAATSTQTYNTSIWFKGEGTNIGKQIKVQIKRASGGTFVGTTATITLTSGWVRFASSAITLGASNIGVFLSVSSNDATNALIWGAQLEQGGVATSYIPTTTVSGTRNADVISLTGVAGLIGQTEGTIYFEYYHNTATNAGIRNAFNLEGNVASSFNGINFATSNNGNDLQVAVQVSSSSVVSGGAFITSVSEGWHKVAFGYNAATNGTSFYFDGNLIATRTLTSIPAMSRIAVMARANPFSGFDLDRQFNNRIRAASIYQTRLPNTTTDGSPSLQSITTL